MARIVFIFLFVLGSCNYAFAQSGTVPNAVVTNTEFASQQIRAEERKIDLYAGGLKWIPWEEAGENVHDFIFKREDNAKSLIASGHHVDIAVYDMDHNNQPDIVLLFWDYCGFEGCLYKIYYDEITKKPDDFFGWQLIPFKKGVMLDHAYFSL